MLNISKRLLIILVVCIFTLTPFSAAMAQSSIQVEINGKEAVLGKTQPYLNSGMLMLPLRSLSEALGASVSWDGASKNIKILRGKNTCIIKQGSDTMFVNGRTVKLSAVSVANNGSTYASQDFIQNVFGFSSSFDSKNSRFSIEIKSLPVYFSDSFSIEYLDNGCKLVIDGEKRRLLLVPQGKTAPKNVKADKTISIPLKRVMAASTTQVSSLLKLGVLDSLKAVTTDVDNWNTPEIKKVVQNGSAKYVGGENMGQPDYEQVKVIDPDLTFVYTGSYGQQSVIEKLDEIGVDYAVNNEYLESHYLGRLEWSKFMGAFYDKELEAEKMLNEAVKEIDNVSIKVAGHKKPKVVWCNSFKGNMQVQNAGSYISKWIDIAGGDYVFKNVGIGVSSSSKISNEEFYSKAKDADILIYSSSVDYLKNPTIDGIVAENPLFADLKAVKNGNVYAYAADWYETITETDKFVKNVAAILHPDTFPGYASTKLVKLPKK